MILHRKYILFAIMVLLVGATFWSSSNLQDLFQQTTVSIKGYIDKSPFIAGFIFVALAAFSAVFSPFSSAPLIPFVVAIWGNTLTFILLVAGWFLGGLGTYWIGRVFGSPLFLESAAIKKIEYYRARISRRKEFGLVLLFRFAIPSEIGGYVLGLVRYHFSKYILATLISEGVFGFFVVYLSTALVSQKPLFFILLLSAALFFVGASFYILRRRMKNPNISP